MTNIKRIITEGTHPVHTYRSTIIKKTSIIFIALIFCSLSSIYAASTAVTQSKDMNFVTCSDTEHFPWLVNLIESIMKYNYTKVASISVFDLGLTQEEIEKLEKMPFVKVYEVKDVNPDMRTKFIVRTNGRLARGWYSWKPVVFYQALQLFPYFLYIDSGIEVVAPLDDVFDEIKNKGYWLYDSPHLIWPVVTQRVLELFELEKDENKWILETNVISAGLQGVSRSLLDSYIAPMYELAKAIKNFEDDGSALWGYGFARHDQVLFSIFARRLGLKIQPLYCNPKKLRRGNIKMYFGALKYFKLRKHKENNPERLAHMQKHMLAG